MLISKIIGSHLSFRLNVMVVCMMALLLTVSLGVMLYFSRQTLKQEAMNDAWQTLDEMVQHINNILITVEQSTENINEDLQFHLAQPERMFTYSTKIVENNPYINGCAIVFKPHYYPNHDLYMAYVRHRDNDMKSKSYAKLDTLETFTDRPYSEQRWYLEPMAKLHPCWTAPLKNEETEDESLITFCQPIFDSARQCVGVVAVDVSISLLSEIVLAAKPSPNSYCTLLDSAGSYIVHPDKEKLTHQTVFTQAGHKTDPSVLEAAQAMVSGETGYKPFRQNHQDWIVFYKPFKHMEMAGQSVEKLEWSVGLIYSENDIFGAYNVLLYLMLVIAIVGLVLFYVLIRMVTHRQLKPLQALTHSARHIANGNFSEPIPDTQRDDEIGRLQENFRKMQQSLAAHVNELEHLMAAQQDRGEMLEKARDNSLETDKVKTFIIQYITNQMMEPSDIIDKSVTTLCNNYQNFCLADVEREVDAIQEQSDAILDLLKHMIHAVEIENEKEAAHE